MSRLQRGYHANMNGPSYDTIVNLAMRRGIVFPSSEIYGGLRAAWDYGPIGVELANNIKQAWWQSMVQMRRDVVGLDSAVILHPRTWVASNHVESFTDPLVECLSCHQRWREDQIGETCPNCGSREFTDPRNFNLMFKTNMGPVADADSEVWLRPETCQGIFLDFQRVLTLSRKKVPFGIAQIGRVFRNEITPSNSIFRTREFEQMELEFFVKPGTDGEWHQYWIEERQRWYAGLGMTMENLQVREHSKEELSHYSSRTVDLEYRFPWGWGELEGIANRSDYDLKRHSEFSGKDLSYYDQEAGERYVPYVIEPSVGVGRALFAFIIDAYSEDEAPTGSGGSEKRVVLRLHRHLAPYKAAVLPLSRNERLVPLAKEVADLLQRHFRIDYDDAGAIGRRYRRHDEIGTPYAVTVDFDSVDDSQVTIRDRDSMQQERIPIGALVEHLTKALA